MFLLHGIFAGIFATLLFDIFQISLSYAYNIKKSKWNLIGRYFYGLIEKKYFRENLEDTEIIKNELILGYIIHYLIGSIFGIVYVLINVIFFYEPSVILSLIIGFITVLGSWVILMPLAFNIGFFASKKEEQIQLIVQNLLIHFIFGIGLYLGYLIIISI